MCLSRRDLLGLAMFRAARARAGAQTMAAKLFDIEQTSPHTWIALARPAAMLNCNAAIFELSNGLLVVDTHSKSSAASALVAQLRREVSPKPVRYVVNTHFHYDHAHGNGGYRVMAPQAQILATKFTSRMMRERAAQFVKNSLVSMEKQRETARQAFENAKNSAQREYWKRMVLETTAYLDEMQSFFVDLPDVTFDEGYTLHDPLQEIRLEFHGRAHTASDLVVWSPQQRVVATGDLLVGFLPGMGDGFPAEWPATLRKLSELDFRQVLPGHGAVQQGRTQLHAMRAYIEELNQRVGEGKRAGRPLSLLQAELTPATLRTLAGEYGKYVSAMTARFRPLPPGVDPGPSVAEAVRGNVTAVYRG